MAEIWQTLSAKKKEEEIAKYLKTLESESPAMPSVPKYGDVHESYSNMFYEELTRDSISEIARNIELDLLHFPLNIGQKYLTIIFLSMPLLPDLLARRKFRPLQLLRKPWILNGKS